MRAAKILGFVVGGIAALLVLALLAVWLLINPNDYKSKLAAAVKDATGRDLVLQGDIKLSVIPWVALELGPASLGNPPGFGAQSFLSFQHAAVRAKLLPLLHERLEISRIEIDGLDVRLLEDAQGRGNWTGFAQVEGTSDRPVRSAAKGAAQPLQGVAGIKITHGRVSYQHIVLENLTVETAPFGDGVIPISIHCDANRGVAGEHSTVELKADFSHPDDRHYQLAALTAIGQVSLAGDDRPIRWHLSLPSMDLDLEAQTLVAPSFEAAVAGAQINGSLQGTRVLDDMSLAGAVTLAPVLLREFLPRWQVASPQTTDPRAFSQLSGSAMVTYDKNALRFDSVRLTLDDTHVQGQFAVDDLATRALTFDLSADRIDVGRYLPPEAEPPAPNAPQAKPAEAAAPLAANGTLAIGAVHLSRLDLTDVRLTLAAKDGVMRVFPLQAQIDGGRYTGDLTLDRRGSVPVLSMDEHLSGVDVAQLMAANGKRVHLSGRGNLAVKAVGHGTGAAILRSLDGHVDAAISGGALEGIDLGFELDRAEALLKLQSPPAAQSAHRTPFDAFKMSADITHGVVQTRDLTISSPALRVTGQGSTNLVTQALDLHLVADTRRTVSGVPIQLPVSVTGTTASPVVRPDLGALANGQLRQKLRDVLRDKLQGLFGKP